jgi:hypothetical protein
MNNLFNEPYITIDQLLGLPSLPITNNYQDTEYHGTPNLSIEELFHRESQEHHADEQDIIMLRNIVMDPNLRSLRSYRSVDMDNLTRLQFTIKQRAYTTQIGVNGGGMMIQWYLFKDGDQLYMVHRSSTYNWGWNYAPKSILTPYLDYSYDTIPYYISDEMNIDTTFLEYTQHPEGIEPIYREFTPLQDILMNISSNEV